MGYDEYYKARDIVTDIIEKDLVGPVEKDEIIQGLPTSCYIIGKLYPRCSASGNAEQHDTNFLEDSEEPLDSPISLSNQFEPSSMGITFAIRNCANLRLMATYATYEVIDEGSDSDAGYGTMHFKRHEHSASFDVEVQKGTLRLACEDDAEVYVTIRDPRDDGARAVTATIANGHTTAASTLKNSQITLFQVRLAVSVVGNGDFVDIDWRKSLSDDPELADLELLYRDTHCFAQGHGCSAAWDESGANPSWVSTEVLPKCPVLQMMPLPSSGLDVFKMAFLVDGERDAILSQLDEFVGRYQEWIDEVESRARVLPERYRRAALSNVLRCRDAQRRLTGAIRLLGTDDDVLSAFRLANQAMLLQWERASIRSGKSFDRGSISWYPFQLAFILQELESIANPKGKEREIVDLLWFPTGGGKTEAYLGIAAFCIFLRRIRDSKASGVTVMMRYTLRLLTIQQFERASTMICACEYLRRRKNLGGGEISIGLWVGGGLTPNKIDDAYDALASQQQGVRLVPGQANPMQVTTCPWCGSKLQAQDYAVDKMRFRMRIHCPNEKCAFHGGEGIPVHLVDEDIYEHLPTFIVATVDKFAQVPKKEETSRLFGIGANVPPPELIIQDELHLISGPLGTVVGIYEGAIDRLCERDGVKPKIIASTATVRNAAEQINALYGERHAQFPPQGIDIGDSFFAIQASPDERPSRLYLGAMGVGTTQTTSLIRTMASVLFATRYLEARGFSDEVVDSYWTIVGYFCTLRELGSALTATLDRVQTQYSYLAATKFAKLYPGVDPKERHNRILELTSRKNNSEIVDSIHALEMPFDSNDRFDAYSFVLATNMISVGVDVSRLGVMVVDGQPKSNSEYIQATSRVGRSNPGLVIDVLSPSRSRDRSHYEQFPRFHKSLYKAVESTSVTPFSDRARDRGLHTLFITLCRYLIGGLGPNSGASRFRRDLRGVDEVIRYILDRVSVIDPEECEAVSEELERIADEWEAKAENDSLVYWDNRNKKCSLLKPDLDVDRFRTMNSMRNVEPSSNIYIVE